jgi:hypothetical protein
MPDLVAGPRDPVTKAQLLYVSDNPNAFDEGAEAEVALGVTLPVYLLSGSSARDGLTVGVEAAVFARFGLQVIQRELIATDWVFAVPLVRHVGNHWFRVRYYHTSSHLGDEYSRRFQVEGVNFARDAVDALSHLQLTPVLAVHSGVGWSYNVHPEDSRRWAVRLGVETEFLRGRALLPYLTMDALMDQDNGWAPRQAIQLGVWLPKIRDRRSLRAGVELLTGPSPLGQFQGRHTTQLGLGFFGSF